MLFEEKFNRQAHIFHHYFRWKAGEEKGVF